MTRTGIKIALLRILRRMEGEPMPEAALRAGAQNMFYPAPSTAEVDTARKELEEDGYIAGLSDDLTGVSWSLTQKGEHKAAKI